jgi:hypothetical protein
MILLDNRPTTLTLQQIPSDQIDRIEVITNPSVKYDASTTGGILNVILKKNNKPGYNGMVMTSIGTGNRYMGMANLNIKENPFNFFGIYTWNYGSNTSSGYTGRQYSTPNFGIESFDQWNNTLMTNQFHFGRGGFDYFINNRNLITVSGNIISGSLEFTIRQTKRWCMGHATTTRTMALKIIPDNCSIKKPGRKLEKN